MTDVTIPLVVSTIIIISCKLGLFLLDRYYPTVGSEVTSIIDSLSNLHQKVDSITPSPQPKTTGPISIKVIPL